MKYIVEQPLSEFKFWSGAKLLANRLTSEQFDLVEAALEEQEPEGGYTDSAINDIFWFDSHWVEEMAGLWPQYYELSLKCGLKIHVKADDEQDVEDIVSSGITYTEEEYVKYEDYQDVSDLDIANLNDMRLFRCFSCDPDSKLLHEGVFGCTTDDEISKLKHEFPKVEELQIDEVEDLISYDDIYYNV